MLIIFSIVIFLLSSSQSHATELQSNNVTSDSVTDFFPNYQKTTTSINGFNVSMAIASTNEQRIRGLSGLEKMNDNEGMIFLFDEPSKQGFWMNKMNCVWKMWKITNGKHCQCHRLVCRIWK